MNGIDRIAHNLVLAQSTKLPHLSLVLWIVTVDIAEIKIFK